MDTLPPLRPRTNHPSGDLDLARRQVRDSSTNLVNVPLTWEEPQRRNLQLQNTSGGNPVDSPPARACFASADQFASGGSPCIPENQSRCDRPGDASPNCIKSAAHLRVEEQEHREPWKEQAQVEKNRPSQRPTNGGMGDLRAQVHHS